jgi:hypothetical protein
MPAGLEGIVLSPRMVADALAKVRGRTVGLARVPRVSPDEGSRARLPALTTRKKSEPGRNKSAVRPKWLGRGRSLGASPIRHFVVKHREQPI